MTDEQLQQFDAWFDGLNGAINRLAENVSPVDSSVHQAIADMSENLAKWQAAQTEVIKEGFALLVKAVSGPPIGETSIKQDLEAIIEMLKPFGGVPADLGLVKEELSLIHGLVVEMAADPEKAKELSERIRKQVEALKSATPKSE